MNYLIKIIFLSILLLAACSESDNPTDPEKGQTKSLVPLAVGNMWVYNYFDYYDYIFSTENWYGKTLYRTSSIQTIGFIQDGNWFINLWDGGHEIERFEVFKYPEVYPDERWVAKSTKFRFIDKDIQTVINDDTFYCYKYEAYDTLHEFDDSLGNRTHMMEEFFFDPKVGMVKKQYYYMSDSSKTIIYERKLTHYELFD